MNTQDNTGTRYIDATGSADALPGAGDRRYAIIPSRSSKRGKAKGRPRRQVMLVPTKDRGNVKVAVIDLFPLTLDGHALWVAVHTSAAVGVSRKGSPFVLIVAEYLTGRAICTLAHGLPRKYKQEQAQARIDEVRQAVGDAALAARLRKSIAQMPLLNLSLQGAVMCECAETARQVAETMGVSPSDVMLRNPGSYTAAAAAYGVAPQAPEGAGTDAQAVTP